MSSSGRPESLVLWCGEVRTCLLPASRTLGGRATTELLRLRAGEHVRISERPSRRVTSPDLLTGVDCMLPTSTGVRVRAIGTVTSRASITEGRLLQATAHFGAVAAGPETRRHWGHYLVRRGLLEPVGKLHIGATAEGVLRGPGRGELDLGMIAECLLSQVQCRPSLDRMPPFKSRPTRLRWAASRVAEGEQPSLIRFTLAEDGLRTVELRLPEAVPPTAVATLCEDFALHDWLLTTVIHMLDRSLESDAAQAARVLRPVVDHLLHLWMPHAHVDPVLISLWDALERTPGFSRQWQNLAQRIRDQVAGWPREVNE